MSSDPKLGVAVIGLALRAPGADDEHQFWTNLEGGVESMVQLSDDSLRAAGVPEDLIASSELVKVASVVNGIDLFDADFFSMPAREAVLTDPQHRLLFEVAWSALEDAGYIDETSAGKTAVFAAVSPCSYPMTSDARDEIYLRTDVTRSWGYVATKLAYKLGFTGPALNLFTACSTGLVAVHSACESLLTYQADMALACTSSLYCRPHTGYLHVAGALSPDGHCRAFDADAGGMRSADGVATIVLKRLEDAVRDRDPIRAVIRASAINNDGPRKISFYAPSIEGQAEVIANALALADVSADEVSYVEAHGTATALGDPIEIEALSRAFRRTTQRTQFCAIGSLKSAIGHTDVSAGLLGLIKVVLALENRTLPPSLHYRRPNPNIDFASSPVFVNAVRREWVASGTRIAGVSAFGIGGTNAHAILQEAPPRVASPGTKQPQLLVLSARSKSSLVAGAAAMAERLMGLRDESFADVAYTLQMGRRALAWRCMTVATDLASGATQLKEAAAAVAMTAPARPPQVAFMYPGGGTLVAGWGRALYEGEPVFRERIDVCAEILRPVLDLDLHTVIVPTGGREDAVTQQLQHDKAVFLTSLLAVEHALTALWLAWGFEPAVVFGHSAGEYAAACAAGVLSIEDALRLAVKRARLADALPAGQMLAVLESAERIEPRLPAGASIGAVNGRDRCTVAGSVDAITATRAALDADGIEYRLLDIPGASHSPLVEPALGPYREALGAVRFMTPKYRMLSCLTGDDQARVDTPDHWVQQFRQPVRFSAMVDALEGPEALLVLELGPGHTLSRAVHRHWPRDARSRVVLSIGDEASPAALRRLVGEAWKAGAAPQWTALHDGPRARAHLPTYRFERKRFWPDNVVQEGSDTPSARPATASTATPVPVSPQRSHSDLAASAPLRTATEVALAETWRELLKVDAVGADSDFFNLGGDSLVAVRMVKRVRAQFGVELALRPLLTNPTLGAMAALIDEKRRHA